MKQAKYDVLVLGSGIGGLCSAALLAKEGYKTLVVEKLPTIGGRCATLDYKGFKVPTGVMGIPLSGVLRSIFDEVGADFEVTPMTVTPKYLLGKKFIEMPRIIQPADLVSRLGADPEEAGRLVLALQRAMTWNPPSNETTLAEFLHQYTRNERVIAYFNQKSDTYLSVNAYEVSASEYFKSLTGALMDFSKGMGLAPGGSIALMKALRRVIEAKGGEVVTRCRAKKILVSNGTAKGAVVEGKEGEMTISAGVVISDIGPQKTVALAGEEYFDPGYLRDVRNMVSSLQIWATTISDRPLFDVPVLSTPDTPSLQSFLSASLVCPELAPKGKYVHYSISRPSRQMVPWNMKDEVDWHIRDLRESLPDFNKYGEVLHVGCYWGEWPCLSNAPVAGYKGIPQKSPVENLYNVGDGVAPKGGWSTGSPGCAKTARIVVEDIEKRFKPGQIPA